MKRKQRYLLSLDGEILFSIKEKSRLRESNN